MMKCHGLRNPLGCPLCEKTFSGKAIQRKHISSCQELPKPRRGKDQQEKGKVPKVNFFKVTCAMYSGI